MRTEPSFSEEPESDLLDDISRSDATLGSRFNSESQLLSDYCQHYGLSIDPFVDDPHFAFYPGAQRRQILEQLLHLCQFSHNLLVVTGDYGVGKTRMAQALIDSLDDSDDICFVEGQITSDINSLLVDVLAQFELSTPEDFGEFCKRELDSDGLVVLIIDNAHHLTDEVISGLVGLLQENAGSRLHLVLFSEPYLLDRLDNINVPELVLTDFFLEKFSLAETVDYLNFRMEMADYLGPEIFIDTKVESWWRQSQGQLLLLHEQAQDKLLNSVSASHAYKSHKPSLLVPHIVATSVLVSVLFIGYLYFGSDSKKKNTGQVTESISIPVQTEVAAIPSQSASLQSSSIAAVATEYKPIEQANLVPASSSESAIEKSQAELVVKQSVVPLVQTNELNSAPVQKPTRVSEISHVKGAKKTEVSNEVVKQIIAVKNETSSLSAPQISAVFSEHEKTILSWNASEFTLQIVGLSNEKAAREFMAVQSNRKDLLLFRSLRQGKDWFVVVTGHYPSSANARQAAQRLPEAQLKAAPWPRDLKTIHREIRQRVQ